MLEWSCPPRKVRQYDWSRTVCSIDGETHGLHLFEAEAANEALRRLQLLAWGSMSDQANTGCKQRRMRCRRRLDDVRPFAATDGDASVTIRKCGL
jgi:hypothetical protein